MNPAMQTKASHWGTRSDHPRDQLSHASERIRVPAGRARVPDRFTVSRRCEARISRRA